MQDLIARLLEAKLEIGDEDIADAIWLAAQMSPPTTESAELPVPEEPVADVAPREAIAPPRELEAPERAETPVSAYASDTVESPPDPAKSSPEDSSPSLPELSFQAPAASALPNALELGRALRPLMRKVPSRTRSVLDVEATVVQVVEQDIWQPILKPEPERWLDLELVIEASPLSFIWEKTVEELQREVLEHHGAFRNVRTWTLRATSSQEPQLVARKPGNAVSRPGNFRELVSFSGRRLVLLVSDCRSPLWQHQPGESREDLLGWLHFWSDRVPTVLVQLLPEWLWERSVLRFGFEAQFRTFVPGVRNAGLRVEGVSRRTRRRARIDDGLKLPVVTLDAEPLNRTARAIAGNGDVSMPGFVFDLEKVKERQGATEGDRFREFSPEHRAEFLVDSFLATASEEAQYLAGLMAAAPVSLSVVHLLQNAKLSNPTPVQVAEFYMSGLLEQVSEDTSGQPIYEFQPGVRKLLNQAMPLKATEDVIETLSQAIARQLGISIDTFAAFLSPQEEWLDGDRTVKRFAKLLPEVLRNLGGNYADLLNFVGTTKQTPLAKATSPNSDREKVLQEILIASRERATKLNLSNCELSSLPPEIAQLSQLQTLDLSDNQLRSLPPEIAQLSQLQMLDLSDNQLSSLPPEIAQLSQLQMLDLSDNQLSSLPPEIAQLSQLQTLDLSGNQLPPLPPEVLKSVQARLEYYSQFFSTQTQFLNEAKVLIVGQSGVGKTSLINQLVYGTFNPDENKTDGINIQTWRIACDDRKIRLNVWDFGGQEIMNATHQFFLTHRSLYLIVLDARNGEEESRLEYWLRIVHSFGGNSPIIIVGNKVDQHPLDLNKTYLAQKYPRIKAFFETSCCDGRGIDQLKQHIASEIAQLEHISTPFPKSWFEVKETLEQMEKDYITYEQYLELCERKTVTDRQSQRTLVGFLHDLGIALNFKDDPRLSDTNVLKPEWVTNAVYKIINDRELIVEHKGILQLAMLERILDEDRYPRHKHDFIIELMRKFELCFPLSEQSDPQRYLVPDIIPREEPDTGDWQNALTFEYHYPVLPNSIISRLMVRMHRQLSKNTYWRSGMVLVGENCRALVRSDREEKTIAIYVIGNPNTCRSFLTVIRNQLEEIHNSFQDLRAVAKVRLPEHPEILLDYQELLALEAMGEREYAIAKLRRRIDIHKLLNRFEPESERAMNVKRYEISIHDESRNVNAGGDAIGINQGDNSSMR